MRLRLEKTFALAAAATLAAAFLCPGAFGEGTLRVVQEFSPPDLAAFPPGTDRVRIEHAMKRGDSFYLVRWEFESAGSGSVLLPRDGGADLLGIPPQGVVIPKDWGSADPLETASTFVQAVAAGNRTRARECLDAGAREKFDLEPETVFDGFARAFTEYGLPPGPGAFLPKNLYLPPQICSLALRYSFPRPEGAKSELEVHLALALSDPLVPVFKISEFDVSERGGPGARPVGKDPVAPRGLRALLDEFRTADLGDFPEGLSRVDVTAFFGREDGVYQSRALFRPDPQGRMFLFDLKLRRKEGPPEGSVMPVSPPSLGPLDSLKNYFKALAALETSAAAEYLPAARRENFLADTASRGAEALREASRRVAEKQGFEPTGRTLESLPVLLGLPRRCGSLTLAYSFAGRVKEKRGSFEVFLGLLVEADGADHWVVEAAECDFEEAE